MQFSKQTKLWTELVIIGLSNMLTLLPVSAAFAEIYIIGKFKGDVVILRTVLPNIVTHSLLFASACYIFMCMVGFSSWIRLRPFVSRPVLLAFDVPAWFWNRSSEKMKPEPKPIAPNFSFYPFAFFWLMLFIFLWEQIICVPFLAYWAIVGRSRLAGLIPGQPHAFGEGIVACRLGGLMVTIAAGLLFFVFPPVFKKWVSLKLVFGFLFPLMTIGIVTFIYGAVLQFKNTPQTQVETRMISNLP